MQLIQLLQEASSLPLQDLKKAMSKDKRANPVFKKDLKVEDIPDMAAFLTTLKFYLFNNDNVRSFVKTRDNVKEVFKSGYDELKVLKPAEIDQAKLDDILEFTAGLFKEHAFTARNGMSPDLKKELKTWVNTNSSYHNLSMWARKELDSLSGLKPDKRIILYRGVLFSEYSLKTEKSYDGKMQDGNGMKFLKSIRDGGKEIDINWDKPSSWTTDKEVADKFAKYGPASSNYSATLNWLSRGEKKIDGALGYVISTFANPQDVLIDMRRLTASIEMKHGGEGEVILKPGTYVGRVVKKYTVEGEVDPSVKPDTGEDSVAAKSIEAVSKHTESFSIPDDAKEILKVASELRKFWSTDAIMLLKYPDLFKKLILNSTTTTATHLHDKLNEWYKKELHHVQDEDLRADKYATNATLSEKIPHVKSVVEHFREKISHSKFKTDKNPKAVGLKHELTGDEWRSTIKAFDVNEVERDLLRDGYITSSEGARSFMKIADALGVELPSSARFNQFGAAKQKPVIQETLKKFMKMVGLSYNEEEPKEAEKTMINLMRKAYRNYDMLSDIERIKERMDRVKDGEKE
jgi:hypothetical protein